MSRLRSIGKNLLTLCCTLAVLILVLEWMLRLTGIQEVIALNPPIYQKSDNERISYELIPSHTAKAYAATVTTNALGLRSPEVTTDQPIIAILGDSVAFGLGVENDETIPAYMQKQLPEYHILNGGVSGYTINQEAEQYKKIFAPRSPAATVVMFCFNDFDEEFKLDAEGYLMPKSSTDTRTYAERLDTLVNKPGTLPIPFKGYLQTHSAIFNLLVRATKGIRYHAPENGIFEDPITDAQRAAYKNSLEGLAKDLANQPRMLVIWPETNLHLKTRAFLKTEGERLGFNVLDLYEIYGNTYDSLGWDGHPNAATNKKTADIMVEAMKQWNLIAADKVKQ